jgi:asparaginyl-tRNA synthetase
MRVNEGCIKHALKKVLERCYKELEFLQKYKPGLIDTIKKYISQPFVISSHAECVKMMLADIQSGKVKIDPEKTPDSDLFVFKEAPEYADDLSKDHERYITEVLFGGMPVFVRFFPAPIKSFYMPKVDLGAEVEHVDGFDLLFPEIGEVVGGSQRESDYDKLLDRMKEMGVGQEGLQYYLDLRKYGTCPHGGSGVGMDRLMMICTGIFNIRDMIPFPRAYEHCHF